MSDRGIKKWAPYKSLKEQWEVLDNQKKKEQEITKPTISNEEAEEINEILVNYHGQEVTITYYRNKRINEEIAKIRRIDAYERKLILDNNKIIKLGEIIGLKNN